MCPSSAANADLETCAEQLIYSHVPNTYYVTGACEVSRAQTSKGLPPRIPPQGPPHLCSHFNMSAFFRRTVLRWLRGVLADGPDSVANDTSLESDRFRCCVFRTKESPAGGGVPSYGEGMAAAEDLLHSARESLKYAQKQGGRPGVGNGLVLLMLGPRPPERVGRLCRTADPWRVLEAAPSRGGHGRSWRGSPLWLCRPPPPPPPAHAGVAAPRSGEVASLLSSSPPNSNAKWNDDWALTERCRLSHRIPTDAAIHRLHKGRGGGGQVSHVSPESGGKIGVVRSVQRG